MYPAEFSKAYQLLLNLNVIHLVGGKFLPSKNFAAADRTGVQKFMEDENSKNEASERRRSQNQKMQLAIISSAAIAIAGYFIRKAKSNIPS